MSKPEAHPTEASVTIDFAVRMVVFLMAQVVPADARQMFFDECYELFADQYPDDLDVVDRVFSSMENVVAILAKEPTN